MEEERKDSGIERIQIRRIFGEAGQGGPTIIFIAGMHGNEHAGIEGITEGFNQFQQQIGAGRLKPKGKVYAVAGNIAAIGSGKRFIDEDLNRIWSLNNISRLQQKEVKSSEEQEMLELMNCFQKILDESNGPYYFIDIHSTSSRTVPHIVINDRLGNRKLSFRYPLPVIIGIDSFVNGTVLSFIDEMGHCAIGFEGGRHGQPGTVGNITAFFWLTLVFTGVVQKKHVQEFDKTMKRLLVASQGHRQVYEIFHHYQVSSGEDFEMVPGYNNFQPVIKGQYLADSGGNTILAPTRGFIFLPRYDDSGNTGYFLLKKLSPGWLGLSLLLRSIGVEKLLASLPGVRKEQETEVAYIVNLKVARFFAAKLFHLLGYRRILRRNGELLLAKRSVKNY